MTDKQTEIIQEFYRQYGPGPYSMFDARNFMLHEQLHGKGSANWLWIYIILGVPIVLVAAALFSS